MNNSWEIINSTLLTYNKQNINPKQKITIASFDIDGTIICTKSGKVHPENYNDWKIKYDNCKNVIENFAQRKYKIIFITNQSAIGSRINIDDYKKKIENICKLFDCNISVFASMANDQYRKPKTTIIDEFMNIDKKNSFYCGDAAGRVETKQNKKDFSDTDYKFALNNGIKFYTPEELLPGHNCEYRNINATYLANSYNIEKKNYSKFIPSDKEVIINSGFPGSGKSYYTNKYIVPHNYKYISQDQLKTFDKCKNALVCALKNNQNAVIDNTNPDKEKRVEIIKLCQQYNFKVRSLHFKTSESLSMHNSHYRNIKSNNKVKVIPKLVYNIYKKKFKKPTLSEGFYKIEEIDYVLEDGIDDKLYNMMLS